MLYQQQYQNWADDREGFWGAQAARLDWQTPPQKIFESNASGDRWYVDGVMNTCFNCVDRHVAAGHGARIAFIHDSPITDSKSEMSYAELLDRVELV
ncbi:MAG: propionyl-CoA synthetase, partial [Alphaproteobacteria bacterium]|nr:propionyl-CoA synthetase [Alphaproteobacteria bacterium]